MSRSPHPGRDDAPPASSDRPAGSGGMVVRLGALATSAERQQSLLSLPGLNPGSVVVDLTGLSSVDGATLGAILLLRQALREQGGGVRLRGCSDAVSSVLQSLRLERLVSPQG